MKIEDAQFVKSSAHYKECPAHALPEYAFIGRSNVGKSSLINMLLKRKNLAKTSSTPGKTQLINHFLVNQQWYLTDLPGYGYAKVSKKERGKFSKLISDYLLKNPALTNVFLLVDARHEPLQNDLEFIRFLGENSIPFSLIFTKADKVRGKSKDSAMQEYQNILSEEWESLPPMFLSSSQNETGRDDILNYIEEINQTYS